MERRSFLIALMGAAGALAAALPAQALPPVAAAPVEPGHPVEELTAAIANEDDMAVAQVDDIYWRRRRRFYRRRYFYRPRYRHYRPRYRRCRLYRTWRGWVRRCY